MTTSPQTSSSTTSDTTDRGAAAAPSGPPDPRPFLRAALDQAGRLVHAVTPGDLDRATPCPDYTVRDLLGHVVAVEGRIAHIATGGQPFEVPSVVAGVADDGWAAAWDAARQQVDAAVADDAVLEGTMAHPARVMPARLALFAYVSEVAVHGWDLAVALDRRDVLDEGIAAVVLGPVQGALPAEPRGPEVPFGEVVEVGEDATAYDRLVAWMGRRPDWSPTGA